MPLVTRRFGDRRRRPRFEILGSLWGSLESVEPLQVVNISPGGALVESPVPLPVDSVQRIRLAWFDEVVDQQVRVLHQRQGAGEGDRFLVGVEFLAERPPFAEHIARLVDQGA